MPRGVAGITALLTTRCRMVRCHVALAALALAALAGRAGAQQAVTARSPDGARVATAKQKTIDVFDAKTGKVLMRMVAHKADVSALAYAPDGKLLASGDRD